MQKRRYRLKQRAARQQETRERIVDAAMSLHEEIGPAATTISALADRAGVQRLTVYRHFPDEAGILQACSSKWLQQHPPPDISNIGDAGAAETTRAKLRALFDYYRETQAMWTSLYRDLGRITALDEIMAGFDEYLDAFAGSVLRDWAPLKSRALRATIRHAIRFSTWQSLNAEKLGRPAMVGLVTSWIAAAAAH